MKWYHGCEAIAHGSLLTIDFILVLDYRSRIFHRSPGIVYWGSIQSDWVEWSGSVLRRGNVNDTRRRIRYVPFTHDLFPIIRMLVLCRLKRFWQVDDYRKPTDIQIVENSAEMLYGLIHQRWIISRGGLQAMVHGTHFIANPCRQINTNMQRSVIVPEYSATQQPSSQWADQIVKPSKQ